MEPRLSACSATSEAQERYNSEAHWIPVHDSMEIYDIKQTLKLLLRNELFIVRLEVMSRKSPQSSEFFHRQCSISKETSSYR